MIYLIKYSNKNLEKIINNKKKAQIFLDSELLKISKPYIPLKTGALIASGDINTTPGSGKLVYKTPYAKKQYYRPDVGTPTGALRGGYWFRRVKNDHGKDLRLKVVQILAKD